MAEKTIDKRPLSANNPVWSRTLAQFTWASGASGALSKDLEINGVVRVAVGVANNSTNAITYTTAIKDENGYTLYSKADWAEAATEVVSSLAVYCPDGCTMTITPSGDPGATGGTFDITLIGD